MFSSSHKKIEAEKKRDKNENALHKLMNKTIYQASMENLRNKIDF